MKKVEAIIRKSQFEDVRDALHEIGVNFFSYWDVTGVGNEQKGHVYRGISYSTSAIERRFIAVIVNDDFIDKTVATLLDAAQTGEVGDGKIFISPIEEVYRIRTKEQGPKAIN